MSDKEITVILRACRGFCEALPFEDSFPSHGLGKKGLLAFSLVLFRFCKDKYPGIAWEAGDSASSSEQAFHLDSFPSSTENEKYAEEHNKFIPNELISSLTLEELAYLYEGLHLSEHSKKHGVFYTPKHITKQIVSLVLEEHFNGPYNQELPSVIDPSCGAGIFLREAFEQLCLHYPGVDPREILCNCIYGVDLDKSAVSLARLLLNLKLLQLLPGIQLVYQELQDHLLCGNALIDPNDGLSFIPQFSKELNALPFRERFPKVMERGGFDCIIGNPPYGQSRDQRIPKAENELLKELYADIRNGKVNTYMLFMARAFKLLRSGGACSFIVPNSWLGIRAGYKLRRALLEHRALTKIIVHHYEVFHEPSVETVIFVARKDKPSEEIEIAHEYGEDKGLENCAILPVSDCLYTAGCTIPIEWSDDSASIFQTIRNNCMPLRSLSHKFIPLIALQAYSRGKGHPPQTAEDVKNHIYHTTHAEDDSCYPYLEGSDVKRYQTKWSGKYLKYGAWLSEHPPLSRFSGPRILIREILGAKPNLLTCAITRDTVLYNRSILHIIQGKEGNEDEMWALLAILNSRSASQIILLQGQKSQRSIFPKVVNEDLLNFPIPKNFFKEVPRLAQAARTLARFYEEGKAGGMREALELSTDREVAGLFGFGLTITPL